VTLRMAQEITALGAASAALIDAFTNGGPPRTVLVGREQAEDYRAARQVLLRLRRRLRRQVSP
jgi:hypothetical protein